MRKDKVLKKDPLGTVVVNQLSQSLTTGKKVFTKGGRKKLLALLEPNEDGTSKINVPDELLEALRAFRDNPKAVTKEQIAAAGEVASTGALSEVAAAMSDAVSVVR